MNSSIVWAAKSGDKTDTHRNQLWRWWWWWFSVHTIRTKKLMTHTITKYGRNQSKISKNWWAFQLSSTKCALLIYFQLFYLVFFFLVWVFTHTHNVLLYRKIQFRIVPLCIGFDSSQKFHIKINVCMVLYRRVLECRLFTLVYGISYV